MIPSNPRKRTGGTLGRVETNRDRSARHEKRTAKELGGITIAGSGAFLGKKGDIAAGDFLIEKKQTNKGSISITRDHLSKITREAHAVSRKPAMNYEFETIVAGTENNWVLIPLSVFKELMNEPS